MNNVVVAVDLNKNFTDAGQTIAVLENINLIVKQGEMIAIVGASGSGKTTLLQLLGGLDQPSSGRVEVAGKCLSGLNERQKSVLRNQDLGFVYQFHHLLPEFSALENVCLPLLIGGTRPKQAKEKASHYIEQVGLKNRLNHRMGELSGGERQRIAIARALVTKPKCVLADEPTGNLDELTAGHITDLLIELNKTAETAFIIVTHNQQLAKRLDRILLLENGQLRNES